MGTIDLWVNLSQSNTTPTPSGAGFNRTQTTIYQSYFDPTNGWRHQQLCRSSLLSIRNVLWLHRMLSLASHGEYGDGTDRRTDGHQTVALRFPLNAVSVVMMLCRNRKENRNISSMLLLYSDAVGQLVLNMLWYSSRNWDDSLSSVTMSKWLRFKKSWLLFKDHSHTIVLQQIS